LFFAIASQSGSPSTLQMETVPQMGSNSKKIPPPPPPPPAPGRPPSPPGSREISGQIITVIEESAAYEALTQTGKLETKYRINPEQNADVLQLEPSNSSIIPAKLAGCCLCCCVKTFVVNDGYVRLGDDGSGGFPMYGKGVHMICSPWLEVGAEYEICDTRITNGPHTICTIQQGHVGVCEDMGEPVLLPPGMHQWDSPTLKFHDEVDLSSAVVYLGPYTIVTCDEGYAAITTDNGRQVILQGGTTSMLTHRNWKFEKFMSLKFQSNDLKAIEATSADNVNLHVEATVVWHITEPAHAARTAADTMGGQENQDTIKMLQNDVLKQARASLAMYIGELRYMDTFHMASSIQDARRNAKHGVAPTIDNLEDPVDQQPCDGDAPPEYSKLYDDARMGGCVQHSNNITSAYGVRIISINIISATPADRSLSEALAKGALALANAEMIETKAHANAKASKILVDQENDNMMSQAQAEADSAIIEAEGKKQAAALMEASPLACELQRLQAMKGVLSDKSAFFFGSDADTQKSVLRNPGLIGR